ncbi:bifunctional glycosyltransferase/class I SAM-dependent methyltransferase [Nocardioides zeicaulis]|uniref:Bifunctional glycosyltransferase/class I SAM-dependent methyltransferase n=1 Tax=Nocardioides zeicaulis TaxID=1776857 RepID=A0ABV6E735_9ACTN
MSITPAPEVDAGAPAEPVPHPRVGVLVVAYNAETTLAQTLARLPRSFVEMADHLLVADDASQDGTYEVGVRFQASGRLPMTVVSRESNLGYGGNQKAGYRWAIDHGLDVVVLLHADGQYAPEHIESLVEPLVRGEADAVFGSRMMQPGSALRGGMPLYKYVGNRILSTAQNKLTGLELSEWHSGYRAYRVQALDELPLDTYSDDFDFDTEIILGLLAHRKRIREVPIPTYYGDEICRVNGMAYAKDVMVDVVKFRARSMGFGTSTDGVAPAVESAYPLKPSAHSSHGVLLRWTGRRSRARVLDVGCADGMFASLLREQGHHVTGTDLVQEPGVETRVDSFVQADLNGGLPAGVDGPYDVVVAGDVLEHVIDPATLLDELGERLAPGGEVVVSVPNFGHWYPRFRAASGTFAYDSRGPLDEGHVRFFTRRSFERLVARSNLHVVERDVVGSPIDVLDRGRAEDVTSRGLRLMSRLDRFATRVWPTLFGYQFLYRLERD